MDNQLSRLGYRRGSTVEGAGHMKSIWNRIHTWLDANAPTGYGKLRPGADSMAIQEAESAMELTLPDDVHASYRIHDGQVMEPGLIGGEGWRLLSLQEIVQTWECWSKANSADAQYVPIAWGEMHDNVFLNLDPDFESPGCLMIQRSDFADPAAFAKFFSTWLQGFADKLEDGEFTYSEEHGCIMYTDEMELD